MFSLEMARRVPRRFQLEASRSTSMINSSIRPTSPSNASTKSDEELTQSTWMSIPPRLHKVLILKGLINEIIRTCHRAQAVWSTRTHWTMEKCRGEKYQNVGRPLEFSQQSILTNGTIIFYIWAMPNVTNGEY